MCYIFPQIQGLGKSSTSQYYAESSLEEAAQFLEESYLSKNFYEICEALMQLDTSNATEVFGRPDDIFLIRYWAHIFMENTTIEQKEF